MASDVGTLIAVLSAIGFAIMGLKKQGRLCTGGPGSSNLRQLS